MLFKIMCYLLLRWLKVGILNWTIPLVDSREMARIPRNQPEFHIIHCVHLRGIQQLRGPDFTQFWPPPPLELTSVVILHIKMYLILISIMGKFTHFKLSMTIRFKSIEFNSSQCNFISVLPPITLHNSMKYFLK